MFARRVLQRSAQAQGDNTGDQDQNISLPTPSEQPLSEGPSAQEDGFDNRSTESSGSSISLRRRRNEGEDEYSQLVENRRERARQEIVKAYGVEQARQRMIPVEDIEDFVRLPPECMLVDIKLDMIVWNRKHSSAKHVAEVGLAKDLVRSRVHQVISNPDIPQYVTDVKARFMEVIKARPAFVSLTSTCVNDATAFKALAIHIEDCLTNRRADWRKVLGDDSKLRRAAKADTDPESGPVSGLFIVSVALQLVPKGTVPSAAQLARIAFLRDCFDAFQAQLPQSEQETLMDEAENESDNADPRFGRMKFWHYVDYQLAALRKSIASTCLTKEAREHALASAFTTVLMEHLEKYPPTADEQGHDQIGRVMSSHLEWEDIVSSAATQPI